MGQEAHCTVRFGDAISEGKALLESDVLLFRGGFRLAIPLSDIRSAVTVEGRLTIAFSKGSAVFELGPLAERWAERIRSPRTLVDKLGVKPGARVSTLGVPAGFVELLRARTVLVSDGELQEQSDLIFLQADTIAELERVRGLDPYLARNGAVWVVAPKGGREPTEAQVLAAGRAAGLVDTKVARFSETHTAHRFSIPMARR